MAEKKMTQKDWFVKIIGMIQEIDGEDVKEAVEFLDGQIAKLDNKAEAAKKQAAKKRAATNVIKETVLTVITDELKSRQTITDEVNAILGEGKEDFEPYTVNKVGAQITALVGEGAVEKGTLKDEVAKKTMVAYKLA